LGIRTGGEGTLRRHAGELLLLGVHEVLLLLLLLLLLLMGRLAARLLWGGGVEVGSSAGVPKAIAGRVHGGRRLELYMHSS
jgi:hypothetical protein